MTTGLWIALGVIVGLVVLVAAGWAVLAWLDEAALAYEREQRRAARKARS